MANLPRNMITRPLGLACPACDKAIEGVFTFVFDGDAAVNDPSAVVAPSTAPVRVARLSVTLTGTLAGVNISHDCTPPVTR